MSVDKTSADGDSSPFGDDEVYFGSKPVHLAQVPGTAQNYVHSEWTFDTNEAAVQITVGRASKLKHPDAEVADIVLPGLPCLDPVCEAPSKDVASWPEFLQKPLLKVKSPQPDTPKAYASGVRSSLVKLGEKWYRLKGSGNNDEGFVVRRNTEADSSSEWRDIRGCAFVHTATRENFMVSLLKSKLDQEGIVSCNSAMGYYIYDKPNQPLGPSFPPACIVQETFGDRRFGTHVMAGIEMLFPLLVDESAIDVPSLLACFPAARPGRDDASKLATTAELMSDKMLAVMYGIDDPDVGEHGVEWPTLPRDETLFANLLGFEGLACAQRSPDPAVLPEQWTAAGKAGRADPRWVQVWASNCGALDKAIAIAGTTDAGTGTATGTGTVSDTARSMSVLAYLFSRFGYDCGRIMGGFHRQRVSWGTYADKMCWEGQMHCNAHANNVVLLMPRRQRQGQGGQGGAQEQQGAEGEQSFLGYLDLDMAFNNEMFVDTWGSVKAGNTTAEHDQLLYKEHINFLEVLAGSDTTSGVPMVALSAAEAQGDVLRAVKTGLYDTLVLGYLRGYTGDERFPVAGHNPQLHEAGHALAKLAVVVMADAVA